MQLSSRSYHRLQPLWRLFNQLTHMAYVGHSIQQCDAQQAYVQSELGGVPTWISLPKILRPKEWNKYNDPVCLLKLALYGHPDAGGYWERHCHEHLTAIGFVPVPDWRSTYWHPGFKLLLMVYRWF